MEADLFQQIYDALEKNTHKIKLPLCNQCPISKILWSSFDYTSGPSLEFVWEADYLENNCQILSNTLDDTETVDGNQSTDSSLSKNTNESINTTARDQYEDIDEVFNSKLLTADNDFGFSEYTKEQNSQFESEFCFQDSLISDDTISAMGTQSTLTDGELQPKIPGTKSAEPPVSYTIPSINNSNISSSYSAVFQSIEQLKNCTITNNIVEELKLVKDIIPLNTEPMITSCVDSGIAGTVSMDSELSAYCYRNGSPEPGPSGICYSANADTCDIKFGYADFLLNQQKRSIQDSTEKKIAHIEKCEEVVTVQGESLCDEFSKNKALDWTHRTLVSSLGTSFLTDNCDIFSNDECEKNIILKREFYRETEFLAKLNIGYVLSNEEFVTKFVLAEQICSDQLSTNPILHKFCIVPSRKIVFASYLYSVKNKLEKNSITMNAFSLILPCESAEWYQERKSVIEEMFLDIIPRFKAALEVETFEDLICRITKEFTAVFKFFGSLEKYSLTNPNLNLIKIQFSHLWERKPNIIESVFLTKCITASLICKGRCTIIGNDANEILKLMITLSLFLEENNRLFCLKPFRSAFSPYFRLQAVKRIEFESVYLSGGEAHWPIALIDFDLKSVTYTGPYFKHRTLKRSIQFYQIGQIFKEANAELSLLDERRCQKEPSCDFQTVKNDPGIQEFVENLFLLPVERAPRFAYLDHFQLRLDNWAEALLEFVNEISLPNDFDKRSALSTPWSLSTVRKNLNLQAESAFGIVLARADSLKLDFAEFVCQTARRSH